MYIVVVDISQMKGRLTMDNGCAYSTGSSGNIERSFHSFTSFIHLLAPVVLAPEVPKDAQATINSKNVFWLSHS